MPLQDLQLQLSYRTGRGDSLSVRSNVESVSIQ
jgi:hypothetical protein